MGMTKHTAPHRTALQSTTNSQCAPTTAERGPPHHHTACKLEARGGREKDTLVGRDKRTPDQMAATAVPPHKENKRKRRRIFVRLKVG